MKDGGNDMCASHKPTNVYDVCFWRQPAKPVMDVRWIDIFTVLDKKEMEDRERERAVYCEDQSVSLSLSLVALITMYNCGTQGKGASLDELY